MNAAIKRVPTLFLKIAIVAIGCAVILFCALVFPLWWAEMLKPPQYTSMVVAFVALYMSPIPFYIALFQGFRLLQLIDTNNAFSESSVHALKNITYCALTMSLCYAACIPLAFLVAELDDAPGVVLIAAAFVGVALIVATFAAVLQKLVQSAWDMKREQDLTI